MTADSARPLPFVIHAIPDHVVSAARERSDAGTAADGDVRRLVAEGGEPLRCCLQDAVPGERLLLFNHRPVLPAASPYQESGAVFAHARVVDCQGAEPTARYPHDWRGRPQVLRAYDKKGSIHPSTRVHDGTDPEGVIAEVLSDPDVVLIHSRNIAHGCYMFAIGRA